MNKTALQIYEERTPEDALLEILGNTTIAITNVAPYEVCSTGDMVFALNQKALDHALSNGASLIVVPKKITLPDLSVNKEIAIILSANIGVSHARLKQKYADHDYSLTGWEAIHSSAIIHDSVQLPTGIRIGPNVVIEKDVRLGTNCVMMANAVVQHGAVIGDNTIIHTGTTIGWNCEIGQDCIILSNSVIGGEGFGYSQDQHFNHHHIPHTGNVIIGDRVQVGCNCTFDRGTYLSTTIGDGCIFDNQCHVAHNVKIGENCILVAGFVCGGSSIIGNRVVASGGTMIKDHVTICDNTYLVHRAGVIKDIKTPGVYAGAPVLPMKEYVKSNAIYRELGDLRKMVLDLKKEIKSLTKETEKLSDPNNSKTSEQNNNGTVKSK